MKPLIKYIVSIAFLIQLPLSAAVADNYQSSVQAIIDSRQAPEGVVFEIVSWKDQYLDWALPEVQKLSKQLRKQFPELDIAIVTHGSEQFSLTKTQLAGNAPLKNTVKSLTGNNIDVHVCGTHAEYKGVEAEDFSELIDVAAEGPSQINDYIKLGYVKIKI